MKDWRSEILEILDILEIFKSHFGGPIEEKVSGLEGRHVANPDV